MNYTELHLHTDYSLLDGLNTADEYAARAAELGMTHLAITDHGVLSGHREFQRACKKYGITPILGCEMYISATGRDDRRPVKKRDDNTQAYNHLIVLAMNAEGLRNLNRLSEIAWTEGFYSKPRIDLEVLEKYNEGLIVTSGCLGGLIPKAIANDQPDAAVQYLKEFKRIFGERFFIEIQDHNPRELNEALMALSQNYGVKMVATSDCHYAREEDLWKEQAMLILSSGPDQAKGLDYHKIKAEAARLHAASGVNSKENDLLTRFDLAYPDRTMDFSEYGLFLHDADAHMNSVHMPLDETPSGNLYRELFAEAVENTMLVASMVTEYPYHEGLDLLPRPPVEDPDVLLEKKAWAGFKRRGFTMKDKVEVARLEEELGIVKAKNFSTYFLIEANAVNWSLSKNIRVGPGRGSGAGSLLNYCLGITNVNPIEHNLLFFRFINPERNDFPDIDTDVEVTRRSELKAYMTRQYKHVASIATFGTWQGKQAVRDAARVFLVPLGEVNKALKGADWPSNMDFFELWNGTTNGADFKRKYPEVIELAKFLHGRRRSQGMHAGGLVVSNQPITNYAPMQTAKDNSDEAGARIPLVALDMEEAADVGLIKYDFLGLKALSILSDTIAMVKDRHGVDIDLNNLALDDERIYKSLSSGYTKGVFQCEATPYTNLILKMGGVKNFNDLVASNALVRPGADKSTAGKAYVARNKGEEMIEYHHPDLQEFTKDTYGVIIYQEQVMLTMTELAGMSMATADKVRKIIGKKRDVAEFEQYKEEFINGASKKISKKKAEGLWHDFEAHAGYSFNKSHAVAYSMLSYWTAWLKEYYPLEFMTAVLSNEGDKDSLLDYLMEAKRMNIRMMLPHVNASGIKFEIQSDDKGEYIRFGLANVKYISGKVGNHLLRNRPFANYRQLLSVSQTKGSGISSRTIQALNAIGGAAFADNPRTGNERENFYEYLNIPSFQTKDVNPVVSAQFRPLDEFSDTETFVSMGMVRGIKRGPGWARIEIVDESGTAGVFTSEHTAIESGQMYVFLIANNRVSRYISIQDLTEDRGEEFQEFLETESFPDVPEGMYRVVAFNSRTTKAGKKMADMVLSDEHKNLSSALVFPTMFMAAYSHCKPGRVVDVVLAETKDGSVFVDKVL